MKKVMMAAMSFGLLTTVLSCSESTLTLPDSNLAKESSAFVEYAKTNILTFKSQAAFNEALQMLKTMETEQEKLKWIHEAFPNFISMQDVYEQAGLEMAEMSSDTKEAYMSFMQKFDGLYFPLVEEDAGFYVPMKDLDLAYLANSKGKVIIGDAEVDLRDISDYETLKNLDRAYYENEKPMTRAAETEFFITSPDMNSVGPEYDSGWRQYGKRKIKLKARRRFTEIQVSPGFKGSKSWFHTEFCFRKKTIVGWVNYRCTSNITGTVTIPGYPQKLILNATQSGTSSHDKDYVYPIHIVKSGNVWYNSFHAAPCTATVAFKDISQPVVFNWTMPGIYCKSTSPAPVLPSF